MESIRSFEALSWEQEHSPGWHVFIGDNASGKSTLLRAIALALVGPKEAFGLRFDLGSMVTQGAQRGLITLRVTHDTSYDHFSGGGRLPTARTLPFSLEITPGEQGRDVLTGEGERSSPDRFVWGAERGWFSSSFGPMRRFSGGDKEHDRLFVAQPRLAAHLSLFGEDVALTEVGRWLKTLRFKQLEAPGASTLLDGLIPFINQHDLLPHGTSFEGITSEGVFFRDGRGVRVEMEELSDGFRSILCLALELIRQLHVIYGEEIFEARGEDVVVRPPGVVLIDEIDAHLHPTWQQRVGSWFVRHFPNIQFMVTTHSPLVCHAAESGSIFRLPDPDRQDQEARFLEGEERRRLLYGNVLDAYGTDAFGAVTRSERSAALRKELAHLNTLARLTDEQVHRREQLRAMLPSTTTGEATEELLSRLAPNLFDELDLPALEGDDA